MNDNKQQTQEGQVSCDICKKELPQSEALTDEASDYVAHFCGLDCLEHWQDKPEEETP